MIPDERNQNSRGLIAGGGGTFCPALPDGSGFPQAGKGS